MLSSGGLTFSGGMLITPSSGAPAQIFQDFGSAYITNLSQNDTEYNQCTINSDGTVLAISNYNLRKVFVYSRSGTTWSLQQTITGTGSFGYDCVISSDGLTLAVGNQGGSGKIYTRASIAVGDFSQVFTTTVTRTDKMEISKDGTVAVYPTSAASSQPMQLTIKSGGSWSEIYTLSDYGTGNFPEIAMNLDGTRIALGAWATAIGAASSAGKLTIYSWDRSGTPSKIQEITELTPVANNTLGVNLEMSSDGSTLVAWTKNNATTFKGAAYIYKWDGSQYVLDTSYSGDSNGDRLGASMALGGDVFVMTKQNSTPNTFQMHTRSGGVWSLRQTANLPSGFTGHALDGPSGAFSNRSALSADGKHLVIIEPSGTSRFAYYTQGG